MAPREVGDAKSQPLRAESNHRWGDLNGGTRIIKRNAHQKISATPEYGGQVEPGHLNIVICSSLRRKSGCQLLLRK